MTTDLTQENLVANPVTLVHRSRITIGIGKLHPLPTVAAIHHDGRDLLVVLVVNILKLVTGTPGMAHGGHLDHLSDWPPVKALVIHCKGHANETEDEQAHQQPPFCTQPR